MKRNHGNGSTSVTLQPSDFTNKKAYQDYLVETNLQLVETLAYDVMFDFKNSYTLCLEDLISAGNESLVLVSRTFDPAKGVPFGAYARKAIKRAMCNELRRLLPVDLKSAWKTDYVSFSYGKAFDDSVFNPTDSDGSEYDHSKLNENLNWLSNWDDEEQYQQERLIESIKRLSPEDRDIVESHYGFNGEPLTFKQMGEQRNVSFQAVNKKEKRIQRILFDDLSRCA